MAIRETVHATTEQLGDDLQMLVGAPWGELVGLLAGPPAQLRPALARLGWRLARLDPAITIELASGAVYQWDRAECSASLWAWQVEAPTVEENGQLFERAAHVWRPYLQAATIALGEAGQRLAWDDPGFPAMFRWRVPAVRVRELNPYRLAGWDCGQVRVLLWLDVLTGTATRLRPGVITAVVAVLPVAWPG